MNVLLVHPEDSLPTIKDSFDAVVDLGRAPRSLYETWRKAGRCEVLSLYDFAEEIADLYRIRELLQHGLSRIVDDRGIDWWSVLSIELVPDLLRLIMARRLAARLRSHANFQTTRPDLAASALAFSCKSPLQTKKGPIPLLRRRAMRYRQFLQNSDPGQLTQLLEDKFGLRKQGRLSIAPLHPSSDPVVLLPSAYSNASRTAAEFAAQLPEQKFLLVYTRTSGRLASLPQNVTAEPLLVSSHINEDESATLVARWQNLKAHLVSSAEEYGVADSIGLLDRMPSLLRWGLSHRNAWEQVFATRNVVACLCTDDSNPPTRLPLDLAHSRHLPTVACHHGALDCFMAFKTTSVDAYIAKSELERDYMERVCCVPCESIAGGRKSVNKLNGFASAALSSRPYLVFFSEPYSAWGWRSDEIYAQLLPRLFALARALKLELVLKIHPFDNVKEHWRRIRRVLAHEATEIKVIAGSPDLELFDKTRLAITVQSTTALQCAQLGIPVFLCGWLRDAHSGYQKQFQRFEIGDSLEAAEQIAEIPRRLEQRQQLNRQAIWAALAAEELGALLTPSKLAAV